GCCAAGDGVHGPRLWQSDGTAAGTARVAQAQLNGNTGSSPSHLMAVNGMVDFTAYTAATGYQVWQWPANGAASAPAKLTTLAASTTAVPTNFAATSGALYFTAAGATLWQWRPDATLTPTITWSNPAHIIYGPVRGGSRLTAPAPARVNGSGVGVPGPFRYPPAAGPVLPAGQGRTLSLIFPPPDTAHYTTATATATLN